MTKYRLLLFLIGCLILGLIINLFFNLVSFSTLELLFIKNFFVFFLIGILILFWTIIFGVKKESLTIISLIRELDFIGFICANLCMYLLFNYFLNPTQSWIFIFFFVISFAILCIDKIIRIFQKNMPLSYQLPITPLNFSELKKKMGYLFAPILVKQIFFNILFYLFPLILIWLSLAGLFFLVNLVDYTVATHFFEVITVVSIILGIFQFYIQRIEVNVKVKIQKYIQRIDQIVEKETDFEHFLNFIEKDGPFSTWIYETIFPKLYANDILVKILSDAKQNHHQLITELIKRINGPLVTISNASLSSNQYFFEIERKEKNEYFFEGVNYIKLNGYYSSFFGEKTETKILTEIEKELNIQEFGILTLSNINLFQEALTELISSDLERTIGHMYETHEDKFPQKKTQQTRLPLEDLFEPEWMSSKENREKLKSRIFFEFQQKVISNL